MKNKEFREAEYKPENDWGNPEFDNPWKVTNECQGIGHGAVCGEEATVPVQSFKWDSEQERLQEVTVWICYKHSVELQDAKRRIT